MKKYMLAALLILMFVLSGCTQKKVEEASPKPVEQLSQAATPAPISEVPKATETSPVLEQDLKGVDDNMKRIVEFFTVNKNVHMATVGADGKPSIRTIQFQFFENERIYFQIDTQASVYRDLKNQPYMELITSTPDHLHCGQWYQKSLILNMFIIMRKNNDLELNMNKE